MEYNWKLYYLSIIWKLNSVLISETIICSNEVGGSLVFKNPKLGRYYIKGIVNWIPIMDPKAVMCEQNQIHIATSISYHRNFIRNYTEINQTM